jgi:hypothetical protein
MKADFEGSSEEIVRVGVTILVAVALSASPNSAELAQLPFTRRLLSATSQFLDKAEAKVTPSHSGATKGSALIIFWTSERGTVVSARGVDGPAELQKAAVDAIYKWKFKPSSVNGRPVQMGSAAVVDFSESPAVVQAPKPMTAEQFSPGFQFKCIDGLVHDEPASVEACQQQLETVSRDSRSTASDRFTVHNQYGLVLMKYPHDAKGALEQFSKAIELAPERLDSSNAEWAYAFWYRATAEQSLGNSAQADKDFIVAEDSSGSREGNWE